jgi:hypothetical protein
MDNYRNYLIWFQRHHVFQDEKPTGFVDQNQEIGLDDLLHETEFVPRRSSRHQAQPEPTIEPEV